MYAIEFQSKIRNGIIEIPMSERDALLSQIGDRQVRIIILASPADQQAVDAQAISLTEDALEKGYESLIEYLLDNPVRVPGVTYCSREEAHERT